MLRSVRTGDQMMNASLVMALLVVLLGGTVLSSEARRFRTAPNGVPASFDPPYDRSVQVGFVDANAGLTGVRFGSSSVGDVNGDGNTDLLVTGETQDGVSTTLYFGDGGGSFTPADVGLTGVVTSASNIADVNGDGSPDLLVSGEDASGAPVTTLYFNDGQGAFSKAGGGLTDVRLSASSIADFNNDGALDLFVTGLKQNGEKEATLYLGDGNGSFSEASAQIAPTTRGSSSVGDIDGDGNLDLLVTGENGNAWSATLYMGNGDGSFAEAGAGLTDVLESSSAIGDTNGDGNPDLLITGRDESGTATATLYLGDGQGGFTVAGADLAGVEAGSSSMGDVDGDDNLDLLLTGENTDDEKSATLYLGDGTGSFTEEGVGLTGVLGSSSNVADLDGDGAPDILVTGHDEVFEPSTRAYFQRDVTTISVTEGVTVDDTASTTLPDSVFVSETVGITDRPTVSPPETLMVSEAVTVADTSQVAPPDSIVVNETIGVSDSAGATPPASIQVRETVSMIDAPTLSPVLAAQSKTVASNGPIHFDSTGVTFNFSGVSGSGTVSVKKYGDAPTNTTGVSQSNTSKYRFVIEAGGNLSIGSGTELRLDVSNLSGITDPNNVTIYRRANAGRGTFSEVSTTYDSSTKQLVGTISDLSEFVLASNSEALPVELATFSTQYDESHVLLSWTTVSETNNSGFRIQHQSPREEEWSTLSFVESAVQGGTTNSPQQYRFAVDNSLSPGKHKFRLEQVDLDGTVHQMSSVIATVPMKQPVTLSPPIPNPASGSVTLSFAVREPERTTVAVYNSLGQHVSTLYDDTPSPNSPIELRLGLETWSSGIYIIRVRSGSQTRTQRFTVVK